MQRRPDVAPPGGRHGDQAARGALVQQPGRRGSGLAPPRLVGQPGLAQVGPAVEVVDVGLAEAERLVVQHGLQEVPVGLEAVELEPPQGQRQLADGGRPVVAVRHQLGHQRVVGGADHAAVLDAAVDPQAGALGPAHVLSRARRRAVVLAGPLGAQAHLDRVPAGGDLVLAEGERAARCHRQLQPHQVEAGDQLGDAVLDLQPGVHLQEGEVVAVDQELDRPHADVVDGLRRRDGGLATSTAGRRRAPGRPAPPRPPSGGGAAPSTRGRRGAAPCPWASPITCTSTWRGVAR